MVIYDMILKSDANLSRKKPTNNHDGVMLPLASTPVFYNFNAVSLNKPLNNKKNELPVLWVITTFQYEYHVIVAIFTLCYSIFTRIFTRIYVLLCYGQMLVCSSTYILHC